jgi:hypothetical protein
MRKRARRGVTRRKSRTPPTPGPSKCAPKTRSNNPNACIPTGILEKISANIPQKQGGSGQEKENIRSKLAKDLGCSNNDEECLIEKSYLSHREKKYLLNEFFRPKMPNGWKNDPDMWLTSDDISNVMKQYEKAYPQFKFLGVVPIDFSAPDPYVKTEKRCMNEQFCHVDLKQEKENGREILGAVFNLDPHYKGGSHWVALAVDLKRDCVYYFDSYGIAPPEQVARFMRYLTIQNPKLRLESNGRRFQFSDTECGMYSMYFLIRMIAGESFKKFCKAPIADKWMYKFRNVLFNSEN